MGRKRRVQKFATIFMASTMLLAGCEKAVTPIENIEEYVTEIAQIEIPENTQIIGLGEATHGNRELQTLKKDVFEICVENGICRVFALEADFGGAYRVNEYIHGGQGTAEEAVAELGFGLYRTDEMEDFVEWLREYNESVDETQQVAFYGFDMQRYDNNKEILFSYLEQIDGKSKEELENALTDLTDETVYTQKKEVNQKAAETMKEFLTKMEEQRENYISLSDEKSYKIAYECGKCIMQNATIQAGDVTYNVARDEYMAEKVTQILEIEDVERIMISGHNGHIQKQSPNLTYTCMGEMLANQYGEAYFAIGTDFIQGEVNVINGMGNEQNIYIESENAIKAQIKNMDGNIFYMDVEKAEQNEELSKLIHSQQRIISIGNELSSWQKLLERFYTSNDILADNYDGMIMLKEVTPTERKPMP